MFQKGGRTFWEFSVLLNKNIVMSLLITRKLSRNLKLGIPSPRIICFINYTYFIGIGILIGMWEKERERWRNDFGKYASSGIKVTKDQAKH